MLQSKSFLKKTRRGKVLKVVREHYLRDDISCGTLFCKEVACTSSSSGAKEKACLGGNNIMVIDTNVALHQIDLLENPAISNVVVLSVVLEEVKNRNLSAYNRLRALCSNQERQFFVFANEHHRETYVKTEPGESVNDRNDRAIRVASQWYQLHLGPQVNVILVTNDAENIRKATESGIQALTAFNYVQTLGKPELLDLVVAPTNANEVGDSMEVDSGRPGKKKMIYPEHKSAAELASGLRRGVFHVGKFRMSRYSWQRAAVGSESLGDEIAVIGRLDFNRAFDGDVVAVEMYPKEEWGSGGDPGEGRLEEEEEEKEEEGGADVAAGRGDEEEEAERVGLAPDVTEELPSAPGQSLAASSAKPRGRVVGIVKRNWRPYCGSFEPPAPGRPLPSTGSTQTALFVCTDRRIPRIRVATRQLASLLSQRVVVAVDGWDRSSHFPSGHYVRTIGAIGEKETESEVLLLENDINTRPFSASVLSCLPPLPWSMPSEALTPGGPRRDLREVPCFSVDPPGCRDIDDALHCIPLPNGNFQVGVHIADVTHFVSPGTPLDEEAANRGTSVYLVEKRIDMLPKPLTEDICSLRADVERLAFSVLWEMSPEAEVLSTEFTKSVIKSKAALSYGEAQLRMDDERLHDQVTTDLRSLNKLAKILRKRRMDSGALTLASPEVKFVIDSETQNPLDVGMYMVREANQMVEEFMLAANISVAQKILSHFPAISLLRRHPTPTTKMFEPLLQTAAAVGVHLDISSSKALATSLDKAETSDPLFNKLIRILATRCMTQAVYFPSGELSVEEYRHYGLAAPLYTHFTSPIRRYADVVVHRLLSAALNLNPIPPQMRDKAGLTALTDNLNYRHRNAQMAGRASVELYTLIFFRERPTNEDARIVGVRANGLIVFVPKFGIEGPVYLNPKEEKKSKKSSMENNLKGADGEWVVNEEKKYVESKDGKYKLRVLDQLKVHIEVVEPQPNRPKLRLNLVQDS